jgi:lipoteichoic acid synthase
VTERPSRTAKTHGTSPAGSARRREPRADSQERAAQRARKARFDVFLIVLVVLAVVKAALARRLMLHAGLLSFGFILEVAGIVFLLALADVLSPRRSYTIALVVYSALSIVMLANVIYVSVWGQIVDPSMLAIAGQTAEVSDSVTSILRPIYLAFVIDIPVLIAAAVYLRRTNRGHTGRSLVVAVALLVAAVAFGAQIMWVRALPADVDGLAVAKSRGLAAYQVSSLFPRQGTSVAMASAPSSGGSVGSVPSNKKVQEQVESIRHADEGTRTVPFSVGAYAGKNVIIIQVESLNDFIVGKTYQGHAITPNLDKLIGTSWYFPNTYSQTSAGNTADAEFISNTSLYAPANKPASTTYSVRVIPSLPRLLAQKGYTSLTFHTNTVSMWNRGEMFAALGFTRYFDRPFFKNEDIMWRSSDEVLFRRGADAVRSATAKGPVYAQFVTITSHSPFKYPWENRRVISVSPQEQSITAARYVQSISYADRAIGEFVAKLKQDGLYDNSIIVIYGDHTAMSDDTLKSDDLQFLKELIGRPYNQADIQRVGMVVHLPGQTKPVLSKSTLGEVDIMPTVADLTGVDLSGTPHMGKSAFVSSKALVPTRAFLPGGSFINNSVVFEPQLSFDDGHAFSITDGSPVTPTQQERADFKRAAELSTLSDEWLNSLPRRPDAKAKQDKGF